MDFDRLNPVLPGIPLVESPLFYKALNDAGLSEDERRVAVDLHERGYAVIDFPDDELDQRIERIKSFLAPSFGMDLSERRAPETLGQRMQDAWVYNEDIRAIASNTLILDLLGKLYGRPAFPFQTLNFPTGTQQHLHSDSIHFSSVPERFMCGVWLAMEDVHADAGPLTYLPGSHKWPIISNAMLGRKGSDNSRERAQEPFERAWEALIELSATQQDMFLARKGQALIWAANLLHGGSPQNDCTKTRWSQVTHYYFEDCIYYTPAFSDEPLGLLDLRTVVDVGTEALRPNLYLGETIETDAQPHASTSLVRRIRKRLRTPAGLPADFDPNSYYRLNPDVALARLDAGEHYLTHGRAEGRRYKFRTG